MADNFVPFHDLVDDMPEHALEAFGRDLRGLQAGDYPTPTEALTLRIAGDPEIFNGEIPLSLVFRTVLQLVDRGHLTEDNIERYDLTPPRGVR